MIVLQDSDSNPLANESYTILALENNHALAAKPPEFAQFWLWFAPNPNKVMNFPAVSVRAAREYSRRFRRRREARAAGVRLRQLTAPASSESAKMRPNRKIA